MEASTDHRQPLVDVANLRVAFGKGGVLRERGRQFFAVNDVSFQIHSGETLGLVGESGCGKTTLGRAILRLVEPSAGAVRFMGTDVLKAGRNTLKALRRQMQIVLQDPAGSLNPRMRIDQIIEEPILVHRVGSATARRQEVLRLLDCVGLSRRLTASYPHQLSGGQKQRVGIARALALQPKFLVLDEPVSALDVSIQAQIIQLLEELKRSFGLTYLFIAHNLAVVKRLCDRVAVMHRGQIVELARTDDLFRGPEHPYTKKLLSAVPSLTPGKAG